MMAKKKDPRTDKTRSRSRIRKPLACQLCRDKVEVIKPRDVRLLEKFLNEKLKIRARLTTGNCAWHQRRVAKAIKTAREMALIPYPGAILVHGRKEPARVRNRNGSSPE